MKRVTRKLRKRVARKQKFIPAQMLEVYTKDGKHKGVAFGFDPAGGRMHAFVAVHYLYTKAEVEQLVRKLRRFRVYL